MKNMIVGNLKMNLLSVVERTAYISAMRKATAGKAFGKSGIVLCVPHVHLEEFAKQFKSHKSVTIGVQDVFWESKGSYTGCVSPVMVKNLGGTHAIVGHSERVKYLGETVLVIREKIVAALHAGLEAVVCIGETKEVRLEGRTGSVIKEQVRGMFDGMTPEGVKRIFIFYEPAWAAGTDEVPSTNEIMSAKLLIRRELIAMFGETAAMGVGIGYGGSVNKDIVGDVCIKSGMDGALVGRESLVPKDFMGIVEAFER